MAEEIAERYPPDPHADRGVHHVLRTGESELWPDIPDALIVEAARDEEHLRLIRELGWSPRWWSRCACATACSA